MIRPALIVAVLLVLAGCEATEPPKPRAVGSPGEILVVADSATWTGPVGDAIRETLGRSVAPPLSGYSNFELRRQNLTDANYTWVRTNKNVVFAGALDDSSAAARFIRARLDEAGQQAIAEGRGQGIILRPDLWARNQLVTYATAASDSALAAAIRREGERLTAAYDSLARRNQGRDMFDRGRQLNLEADLFDRHDFRLTIQHDYFLSQDTTIQIGEQTGHFVRLRRVLAETWRDLFVYYEDGVSAERLDSTYVDRVTDTVLEQFVRGVYEESYVAVDRNRPVRTTATRLSGYPALESRGLWRMREDFSGGGFARYAFYEPDQQRLYILFGMVFAPDPDLDKRDFLRQLEIIAHTFTTEPAPEDA